ncbi:MAG: hypothetical protein U5O39_15020 [Gammaproteobacteria bacterium]|nr:hypothetical protein [Gammaproteobacteria bacterium]
MAVIGTPDDAVAQINRLAGRIRWLRHIPADWPITGPTGRRRSGATSYFARYVMPGFQGRNDNRTASYEWTAKNHEKFMGQVGDAISKEIEKDEQEKAGPQN